MRTFRLEREMVVARPPEEVFAFFGEPRNLEAITPPWLHFRILDLPEGGLRVGCLIRYRLRLRGLPLGWTTRIARWEPPHAFVDEQLRGPYRRWVHTHTFEPVAGGTRVRDQVEYAVLGGRPVHALFVRRDLERIFDFRRAELERLLNGGPGDHRRAPRVRRRRSTSPG